MPTVTDPTLPPPTNPDVLTLAVAAAERVSQSLPWLGWCREMDVDWSYFPAKEAVLYDMTPGFVADVVPVLCGMPVMRP